ncbi:MAG: hypothetical protein L0229_20330 [Blastocatellia bacterium]|nr:hypothetical protein [Blastocatellia bacterium]
MMTHLEEDDFYHMNVDNLTRTVQAHLREPSIKQLLNEDGFTEDCLNRAVRAGLVEIRNGHIYATDKGETECSLA